jgi:hypothetical protein
MPTSKKSIVFFAALLGCWAQACQVPVFRYALERWKNDPYQIYVLAEGELSGDAKESYQFFRGVEIDGETPANLIAEAVDLSKDKDAETFRKHLSGSKTGLPAIFVYYPDDRLDFPPVWSGAANLENARLVVDSKVRRETLGRILGGDSAVWLMVESGNREADDDAFSKMEGYLVQAEKDLKLPEGVIQAAQAREALLSGQFIDQSNMLESDIELKIRFTRLRVSRDAAGEEVFLKTLLTMEKDLVDLAHQPMFFPVFGRGRALEPLVGEGIGLQNVLDYCQYMVGACSCEVKKQNPGIDLLTKLDWNAALEGGTEFVFEKLLPPMEGIAMVLGQEEKTDGNQTGAIEGGKNSTGSTSTSGSSGEATVNAFNPWVILLGGFVLVLLIGSMFSPRK